MRNSEGYLASDLNENDEIFKLFEKKKENIKITNVDIEENERKTNENSNKNSNESKSKYQNPAIVKGYLYKIGNSGFRLNKRFFVLSGEEGTLIRFACEEDYPLKPL